MRRAFSVSQKLHTMSWRDPTPQDRKKAKELDEARRSGKVPVELDEDGNEINPHIPTFIKDAPWYINENKNKPSLKHQRKEQFGSGKIATIEQGYERGKFKGPAATSFREGACQNCGAMTHQKKDCVERPRKTGAKYTGQDIKADEVIKELHFDYEGSHDRWQGYEADMYKKVMQEFEEQDVARRKKIAEDRAKQSLQAAEKGEEDPVEDKKQKAKVVLESEKKKRLKEDASDTRLVASNLRVREDRAKYLINLDPDSAFYDPKSRSMRDNPNEGKDDSEVTFTGDNASRQTGEMGDYYSLQKYAWEEYGAVNVTAPSEAEILYAEFRRKKEASDAEKKKKLMAEYGGEEHIV